MAIANLLVPSPGIPQPNFSWLSGLGDTVDGAINTVKQDKSFNGLADRLQGGTAFPSQPQQGFMSKLFGGKDSAMTAPTSPVQRGQAQGDNYQPFPTVKLNGDRQAFIDNLLPAAIEEGKRTGVDPRIIVAQAAQETGWGKSAPGNNYFGIKSHGQGGGNSMMTTEYVNGQKVNVRDSFRGYESPADSVRGYGDFITQNPRYKALREAQGLDNQLAELQASGYATDPNYSRSVGAIARGITLPDTANLEANAGVPYQPSLTPADPNAEERRQQAMTQIVGSQPDAASAVTAMAQGGTQPSAYVDPMVSAPNAASALQAQPRQQALMQVADNSNGLIAQAVTPVQRGGVDPSVIQYMLRDRNLREMGLKLWAANAQGQKASEPWQFVNLPDGTLARANQQTGAVERIGNFGKSNEQFQVVSPEERQALGIPQTDQRIYQRGPNGQISAVGGAGQTINVGNEVEARRQAAAQAGLTEKDPAYQGFILTGKLPRENEQSLTATDKKAILEADEMVQSTQNVLPLIDRALELNDKAYSGPTAGVRGMITGALGVDGGEATQELDNVVIAGALTQLKAIFGGAPTEGERAILLDMSGASSKPAAVRKTIFERAKQAAERRLNFYQQRANDLRGGTFYKPSQSGTTPSPDVSDDIKAARAAIQRGAPRDAVIKRLQDAGIDTEGL